MLDNNDAMHICRLGLQGDAHGVQTYVRRMVRKYAKTEPELSKSLTGLLENTATVDLTRRVHEAEVPVDTDTRLQLLRVTQPGTDIQPAWDAKVQKRLEAIVAERERIEELKNAGLSPTRTALFTGVPGVGKTYAAHWIASQLKKPLVTLDLSSVMSSFLGRTGTNVRYVLEYAKSVDCVLLLDELDAVAKRRDDPTELGELKRLVTVLLQEIDGWSPDGLLLAATNHADLLDPAVWRRFDAIVEFPLPSKGLVTEAIKTHLGEQNKMIPDPLAHAFAVVNQGKSFSDIQRSVHDVRRQSVLDNEPIADKLLEFIKDHASQLNRKDKVELGVALWGAGLNQREASEISGVARETIREASQKSDS